ncbi:MAG: cation diffusion facilitator family transporter [Bacteroidota bacterium]|nr:cation diffusion facilitator family transporter [Bacteroidota bacterium]MDP4229156.1 cation diffusion facilitator family transporter [Bacteroidota bacterium]MDP4237421.1 cation diffusion facilitator family transporter [Bacteroidota bacterium]
MAASSNNSTLRTAWISILVTVVLIAAKLVGGLLSGSLALISLAAESTLDLFSVLLTLFAVRITAKPADEEHLYGHGKFDSISSLFQSLLLLGISVWIFYEATDRLLHPSSIKLSIDYLTFGILIGSFILDIWRSRKLDSVGKEVRSQALQTDALHFFSDGLSAAVVFVGLLFSKYLKLDGADSYAAILVSGFVGIMSIRQGKHALDELTDRFAHTADYEKVSKVISETPGVIGLEKLRMRHSGPILFIDAGITINRVLPFASVEHILSDIKADIQLVFPGAEVVLHPHAVKLEYESTFETIKLITSEEGLLPHNIELSKNSNGEVTLDLHLEFPPESSFLNAHEKSEEIEHKIKAHLPSISKIVLHLEEERPDYALTTVTDITSSKQDLAAEMTAMVRKEHQSVREVRDITLLQSEPFKEIKLALTIVLERNLSLAAAHEIVTDVEKTLRRHFAFLARIVIHSEPE